MILRITGVHVSVDDELTKYVNKKLGRLERYLPRDQRQEASLEVKLKQLPRKQQACEAILTLPQQRLIAEEATLNAYAAIDIVEDALKSQLARKRRFWHRAYFLL